MASAVDICNLALGHLGDRANVASLDPPEGSAQAEHCARFYPLERDTLLELHNWGFATKRVMLAPLVNTRDDWGYAYAVPSDALRLLSIASAYAQIDNETVLTEDGKYSPHPFVHEVNEDGAEVIYTNVEDAVLRYTARVTDTTRFSPLFIHALSWQLAAALAGPVIKGEAGAAEAERCEMMAERWLSEAKKSAANQSSNPPVHTVSWVANR